MLDRISEEVPKPENIQRQGEALQKRVEEKLGKTREELSNERKKLERYKTPTVSPRLSEDMFKLKGDEFRLNFGLKPQNDPRFIPHANKAKEWYKNQPNPYERFLSDVVDSASKAGGFVINLGKTAINSINAINKFDKNPEYRWLRYKP